MFNVSVCLMCVSHALSVNVGSNGAPERLQITYAMRQDLLAVRSKRMLDRFSTTHGVYRFQFKCS
jgi:hypothetical protein